MFNGKLPLLLLPHRLHFFSLATCSTYFAWMGGMTTSCLFSTMTEGASSRLSPQQLHCSGWCMFISSGVRLIGSVLPLWPGCPPDFLSDFLREFFVLERPIWCEGGVLLLSLFLPFIKSLICSTSCDNCNSSASTLEALETRSIYSLFDIVTVSSIILKRKTG